MVMRQAWAQSRAQRLMKATAQIRRTPLVDDDQGGKKKGTPSIVATTVADVRPIGTTPAERAIAERLAGRTLYNIGVPVGTDVLPDDEILVGSNVYQVVTPLDRTLAADLAVVCVEE